MNGRNVRRGVREDARATTIAKLDAAVAGWSVAIVLVVYSTGFRFRVAALCGRSASWVSAPFHFFRSVHDALNRGV
jgi:hypothetical protein